ncbi:Mitochondrial N(5)-glutamine methyltransferase MTQ1 [Escovopsis weberi]|uniref:peptide chain release factor N(5)-glutamine methyltransferase n=1 Tax=Escovopsis weberi TaxID=150374 RepID=A0A0M8N3E8_ESCWE|nr:Mitochondrial N(5)-glutamine methyltransferase MTQ1 [Escovopsis weberi]
MPACRSLESAVNELRWIREHVESTARDEQQAASKTARLCRRRGRGVPLQYILGSQPFGPLDIRCKPGVLIPRPETEAYTHHLAHLIRGGKLTNPMAAKNRKGGLNIVDFCTGTGCIPLLLFSVLQGRMQDLHVLGVDISPAAVELARENIARNVQSGNISPLLPGQSMEVQTGDVFHDHDIEKLAERQWDVMVSNPPYVSSRVWKYGLGNLGYSVRKYEPSLALVPSHDLPIPPGWNHEDVFYSRLLDVAGRLGPRVILLEIGDEAQARRVLEGIGRHALSATLRVEVWRDWPDLTPGNEEAGLMEILRRDGEIWRVPVKGGGHIRSIFMTRDLAETDP